MFLINKQTPMGREEKKRRKNHPLPDGEMGKDEDMLGVIFQAHPGRERPTGANKDRGDVSQGGKRRLLPKPEDQSTAINGSGTWFNQIAEAVGVGESQPAELPHPEVATPREGRGHRGGCGQP